MPSFDQVYGQPAASAASAAQNPPTSNTPDASSLPPEALDLAARLFDLARTGATITLQPYLIAKLPPNLTNSSGDTLLMLASYHGHAETAQMLLDSGADANVLNGRGQSPIAGAIFKGYDDVVKVLFEGGADIRLGRPNAVECARMFKREGCLKVFGVDDGRERDFSIS
ncbi:ankyrin [Ophiobolus disseminans]|uniref:Ankyrin n=1 Tax=Ophiobolus disseminans TaxID=1469910 RepID=A0A6A6ZWQ9_9PLEO|nr:ankyrin [Ophiobolus disseminans]